LVKKPKPIEIKEDKHGSCPQCEGTLVARESKYGTMFIGCSNFPKCDYIMDKEDKTKEQTIEILLDLDIIDKEAAKKGKAIKKDKKTSKKK